MAVASSYVESGVNGEPHIAIYPKFWRGDGTKTGIIYCNGANGTTIDVRKPDGDYMNMYTRIQALVDAGHPVLSCHLGGNQWGNAAAMSKLTAAVAYMQTTMGANPSKIGFIGQSMGHLSAMNWASQNRSKTAFVISSMGVADLADIHAGGTHTASINAAYGGSYSNAAHGAASNPTINAAAKFAGLKWLGFLGASDLTCPPAKTATLAAAIGSSATLVQVAGAHNWATVGSWDLNQIVAFVRANA